MPKSKQIAIEFIAKNQNEILFKEILNKKLKHTEFESLLYIHKFGQIHTYQTYDFMNFLYNSVPEQYKKDLFYIGVIGYETTSGENDAPIWGLIFTCSSKNEIRCRSIDYIQIFDDLSWISNERHRTKPIQVGKSDDSLRRAAYKRGLKISKFPTNYIPKPGWGNGYQIRTKNGEVLVGEKYELTLEEVADFLEKYKK